MDGESVSNKTAFRAGRMAALFGHRICPYTDTNRAKVLSWRCGWIDGEAERLLQAKAKVNPLKMPGTE